jgi:hypothetical protein
MRALLRGADRWTARMATHLLADSPSQRDFLVGEGIVASDRCTVLGHGSVSGVDTRRFGRIRQPRCRCRPSLASTRMPAWCHYLGRVTRDKGVLDWRARLPAFRRRRAAGRRARRGAGGADLELSGPGASRVRFAGYTAQPERFLAAADVLCLPSYREGFGSVVIEAAATSVPAVASRIYGVTDAMVHGETGLLFTTGDCNELASSLGAILADDSLRTRLGAEARRRALEHFSQERMTDELAAFYERILGS